MGPVNHLFSLLCQFEHFMSNMRVFLSKKLPENNYLVFMYNVNTSLLRALKLNTGAYFISLIDATGLDLTKLKNYNLFFNTTDSHMSPNVFQRLVIYNVIDYSFSRRTSFFCFSNASESWQTSENFFKNAGWLERELVEFFGLNIVERADTRNLLLDYNVTSNPLLKNYPTEGHQEIFFNHLSYNLEYVAAEFVEL